jgi:HD-GYP domain-containing protein (c-di-GMP phosphodiesterase class II)
MSTPEPVTSRSTRVPLFVVLLSVVLLVALAPLGLFAWMTVEDMEGTVVASQQERQLHQVSAVAEQIDAFIRQQGRESVKLAEAIARLDERDSHKLRGLLASLLDEHVVLTRLIDPVGEMTTAVRPELVLPRQAAERLEVEAQRVIEQGVSTVPAAQREASLQGPFVIGPDKTLAMILTTPIQSDGQLHGALQEIALLHSVWSDAQLAVPPPTRLYLIGAAGELIAGGQSNQAETAATLERRDQIRNWTRSGAGTHSAKSYELTRGGEAPVRYVGAIAATGDRWAVFSEVDEALALAPVAALRRQVRYGGIVAALLAVAAAIVLGGLISRPARRLAMISKRLSEGDFSVRAEESHIAELDMLGTHFNAMSRRLGELVERFRAAAREVNDMFLGTIRALAEAIDEKDPYTKGHSVRVSRYSVQIGRYLGLSPEDMRALHVSSLLHDVGKIGIDDAILKKPAALTADEFEVMKTHPDRGARILGRIPQMRNMIPGIRFHHERWRGGGYPLGLKSEEIPLQARIIAVADTFDAMTTDRPYQRSFTPQEAATRINDMQGVSLAPEVVEAFNRAYEAGDLDEILSTRPGGANFMPAPAPTGVGSTSAAVTTAAAQGSTTSLT